MTQPTQPIFPPPPTSLAAPPVIVDQMVDAAASTLRIARSLLESGRQVDLQGLDRVIGVLCARALDLPPEQGRAVRPRLAILLSEFDALGVALQPA